MSIQSIISGLNRTFNNNLQNLLNYCRLSISKLSTINRNNNIIVCFMNNYSDNLIPKKHN